MAGAGCSQRMLIDSSRQTLEDDPMKSRRDAMWRGVEVDGSGVEPLTNHEILSVHARTDFGDMLSQRSLGEAARWGSTGLQPQTSRLQLSRRMGIPQLLDSMGADCKSSS